MVTAEPKQYLMMTLCRLPLCSVRLCLPFHCKKLFLQAHEDSVGVRLSHGHFPVWLQRHEYETELNASRAALDQVGPCI